MRVLFLSDHLGYDDGVVHGATTYFMNVLPALKRAGIEVHVCFLRNHHPAAIQLEADGIHPIFLNRGKWDPRALTDLLRLIVARNIQLVHAAGMKGTLLGRIAARIRKCKCIIHLHDTGEQGWVIRTAHRSMAGWTDVCLTVSNAVGTFARTEFGVDPGRIVTLHNGLLLPQIETRSHTVRADIRRELALPQHDPVIGVIGRLSPEKGHTVMLQAMPDLLRTHPSAWLLIVGDGPMRAECERVAGDLGLEHSVRFAGHRSDIQDVLAALDVIAIPSFREGLSYCAMEAMAAGCPVAAFAVGGIPEVIEHEQSGLLIRAGDAHDLIAAIRRLLDDPIRTQEIITNAQRAVHRFSIDEHVKRLVEIYTHLTSDVEDRAPSIDRSSTDIVPLSSRGIRL